VSAARREVPRKPQRSVRIVLAAIRLCDLVAALSLRPVLVMSDRSVNVFMKLRNCSSAHSVFLADTGAVAALPDQTTSTDLMVTRITTAMMILFGG
jgi:hypothetical protein